MWITIPSCGTRDAKCEWVEQNWMRVIDTLSLNKNRSHLFCLIYKFFPSITQSSACGMSYDGRVWSAVVHESIRSRERKKYCNFTKTRAYHTIKPSNRKQRARGAFRIALKPMQYEETKHMRVNSLEHTRTRAHSHKYVLIKIDGRSCTKYYYSS